MYERLPPMRILHVITPSRVSGAELMLLRIAREQQHRGDTPSIVSKPLAGFATRARREGLNVVEAPISGKLNFSAARVLVEIMRESEPDIVHTHLSTATLWGVVAAKRAGLPCVAMMQAANSVFPYSRAPAIIAVSEAVKRHLIAHGVDSDRVSTVHNSIDPAPWQVSINVDALRTELCLPKDALCVGTLAHLTPRKGHRDLLDAIPSILKAAPSAYFLWAGNGVLESDLRAKVHSMGLQDRVRFLGYRQDAPMLHRLFDLFVLPSYVEGLPLVLLEAMACGKPCVATRVAGSPELVEDETTGILVDAGDFRGLASAISRLLCDPGLRESMGGAGRKRVMAEFSLEESVSKMRLVYEREMEHQRRLAPAV